MKRTIRRYLCPTCGENLEHRDYGDPIHAHPLVRLCSAAGCKNLPARGNFCSDAHSMAATRARMRLVIPSDGDLGQGGEWLRRERVSLGLSRVELARLLGIHPNNLYWAELTNAQPIPASWVRNIIELAASTLKKVAPQPVGPSHSPPFDSGTGPLVSPASPECTQPASAGAEGQTAAEKQPPMKILSLVVREDLGAPECTVTKTSQAGQILTTLRCNTAFLQGVRQSRLFGALLDKLDRLAELPGSQEPKTSFDEMVERVMRGRQRIAALKRLSDPCAPEDSPTKKALHDLKERLAKDKKALLERYLGPALDALHIEVASTKQPITDPFGV